MAKKIAVLGGGAAGLTALRHLVRKPKFHVTAYEQSSRIGGTWIYTDKVGRDEHGIPIHSSMYKDMLTNLPKEVMGFPDFPFPKGGRSFIHHSEVLRYLEEYADKFDLCDYIQFNTTVDKVTPVRGNSGVHWEVTVRDVYDENKIVREKFDVVFVCTGHYAVPSIPGIPGESSFRGEISHSHNYRIRDPFAQKTVLFLGAGPSGQDIAIDVAKVAKKVYLSHDRDLLQSPLPENVMQTPGLKSFTPEGVVLKNGMELSVDAVMFCTGYQYTYPFLSKTCNVEIKDGRITPLYKHIIHTQYPSLIFIGICHTICPFPNFDMQVQFAIASLDGTMILPDEDAMNQDILKDYRWRLTELGWPNRYAHKMGEHQWGYLDDLAELAGLKKLPKSVPSLYDFVHSVRRKRLCDYKKDVYEIKDEENFEIVDS